MPTVAVDSSCSCSSWLLLLLFLLPLLLLLIMLVLLLLVLLVPRPPRPPLTAAGHSVVVQRAGGLPLGRDGCEGVLLQAGVHGRGGHLCARFPQPTTARLPIAVTPGRRALPCAGAVDSLLDLSEWAVVIRAIMIEDSLCLLHGLCCSNGSVLCALTRPMDLLDHSRGPGLLPLPPVGTVPPGDRGTACLAQLY